MLKPLFETKTLNFAELLGNSKIYKVPKFQRSYSWDESNWEDLWIDILSLRSEEENVHYLGTIVLQTNDNKTFTIIDGQQRIVTFSIIILACLKLLDKLIEQNIDSDKNKERKEIFTNQFIGFKDPKALTYQSKLTLNDTDKDVYNSYLIQLEIPTSSNLSESNKLLINAFKYFTEKLEEVNFENGESIADFIGLISNNLIFIQITVDDVLSAYTVFETLNARGLELTTTDLLKNYFFSLLNNEIDINNLQPRWDRIVNIVSYRHFPTFLRYFLNSRQSLVRSERLFKELKNKIKHKDNVIEIIKELEKYAEVYVALDDPEHEFWKNDNDIKNIINELRLFKVQQYKSLLLAVYFSMPNNIKEVLKIIWALTFRYNVIAKFNPNELERSFNDVAIKVHNKTITTPADIHKALEKVYIGDELFKNLFSTVTFDISKTHVKKLVRYILLSIENQQHHKSYDTLSTMDSIEHIFPKNYEGSHNINLNMLDRLGNLTILETQLNLECGNKPFEQKKELYCKSQYIITSELFKFEEWGENEIRERQRQLSRIATAIWRSPYA